MPEKKEKKLDVKKVEEKPEDEKIESKEPEIPEKKPEGFDGLMNKSVAEIEAIAKEKGLNSRDYITKDRLAKAILEVEKSEEEKPEEKSE